LWAFPFGRLASHRKRRRGTTIFAGNDTGDFLHLLERYRGRMPAIMDNRFELCMLTGAQALKAVTEPGRLRINARELWEQMNSCSCLNLILACIVYWQAREISRVLSQCDLLANGERCLPAGTCQPHLSGITSCSTASILDRKLVCRRRRSIKATLSV
jgi:hypothetical protein